MNARDAARAIHGFVPVKQAMAAVPVLAGLPGLLAGVAALLFLLALVGRTGAGGEDWLAGLAFGFVLPVLLIVAAALQHLLSRTRSVAVAVERFAQGELDVRIPETQGVAQLNRIARSFNRALGALVVVLPMDEPSWTDGSAKSFSRPLLKALGEDALAIADSADRLNNLSLSMGHNAESTAEHAQSATEIAGQLSDHMSSMAVASEKLSTSVSEISASTARATEVACQAVEVAGQINNTITGLGRSSSDIGDVVKVISAIAEQTNMLALNATIEAARAGHMGKGFAVVANEVKELANETAKATDDIAANITSIQADSTQSVEALSRIQSIISQINESQSIAAETIREQLDTTREMARYATDADCDSSEIAERIEGLATDAQGTKVYSAEVMYSAKRLGRMADQMKGLLLDIGEFDESARLVTWDSRMSVGVDELDEQHKVLLDLTNQLHRGMANGLRREVLKEVLLSLSGYAELHFEREECLMRMHGYPDLEEHALEHQKMRAEVAAWLERVSQAESVDGDELTTFLDHWLTGHIRGADQRYAPHMAAVLR